MAPVGGSAIKVDAGVLNAGASGLLNLNLIAVPGPNGTIILQQVPAVRIHKHLTDINTIFNIDAVYTLFWLSFFGMTRNLWCLQLPSITLWFVCFFSLPGE